MKGKTNLNRLLKPLNFYTPPLHDLIIRSYVKHPQKICRRKFVPPCKAFYEKSPPILCRGEKRYYALPISKSSSQTFVLQITTF